MRELINADHTEAVRFQSYVSASPEPPLMVPLSISVECSRGSHIREPRRCSTCSMAGGDGSFPIRIRPDRKSDDWLQWAGANRQTLTGLIRRHLQRPRDCPLHYTIESAAELSAVMLFSPDTPPLSAFSLVPGLVEGRLYALTASKLITSNGRITPIIFPPAERVRLPFEGFELDPAERSRFLQRIPHSFPLKTALASRVDDLQAATGIVGRPRAHLIALLTFHSRLNIEWRGRPLGRGTLDTLIIGPQGTGKSEMSNALVRYFGLGSVISGEIASRAGLLAGSVKGAGGRLTPAPGRFAMAHRQCVIVDEAHHFIQGPEFGQTSQWRSSGRIVIDKAGANRAWPARVRLLWIANPPTPARTLQNAMTALIDRPEDRRRFDLALLLRKSPPGARPSRTFEPHRQTDRAVLLHTWAQTGSPDTTDRNLRRAVEIAAERLRKEVSPHLPELVDVDAVEETLVRIAVAASEAVLRPPTADAVRFAAELVRSQLEGE